MDGIKMKSKYIVMIASGLFLMGMFIAQPWKSLVSDYFAYDSLLDKISIPAEAVVKDNPTIAHKENANIINQVNKNMQGYSLIALKSFLVRDTHSVQRVGIRSWLNNHNMHVANFSLLQNINGKCIRNSEVLKAGLGVNRYLVFIEAYSSILYADKAAADSSRYPASRIILAMYSKDPKVY